MAGWMSFVLIAVASMIAVSESGVIPSKPLSGVLDAYGNPMMFSRDKRTAVHPYSHRTMMLTGYYRPIRRSNNGGQATGVFAQGNAVSGETFFGGVRTPHLKNDSEPIEEPEISSAEAQAAPIPEEQGQEFPPQQYHHQEQHNHRHHEEEEQHHQEHHEPEQIPLTTEIAQTEEPIAASTKVSVARPKAHRNKKTQVTLDTSEEDDEEEVDDEEDDEPVVPFVPFKGNKRRQGYPNLNNFFPMVFSYPRLSTRAGSSGSFPDAITAIANSYSTAKGGIASSVATAYGGSPSGKKRRPQQHEE